MMRKIWLGLLAVVGVAFVAFLVLPWLLPRPGLDGSIPDQPFADSGFAEIDNIRLHYRARLNAGRDQPMVVLIHGFGGSSFSWRHSLDSLEAAGYRTVAVDLPPFGYSQRAGLGAHWHELVFGLVDSLDEHARIIVVGHSMGASVAARMAAQRPERVSALILVAGGPQLGNRGSRRNPSLITWIPSLQRWVEVIAAYRLINEDNVSKMLASAFGREPDKEEFNGYYHPLTIPDTYPALMRRLANERQSDTDDWLNVATYLIWGEDDSWVPLSVGQRLVQAHPTLSLEIMPDAGHNPMDTEPEAFNNLLLKRIAEHD